MAEIAPRTNVRHDLAMQFRALEVPIGDIRNAGIVLEQYLGRLINECRMPDRSTQLEAEDSEALLWCTMDLVDRIERPHEAYHGKGS